MSGRRIPGEVARHFARALAAVVDAHFGGKQTAAAKALGVSQSHLSGLLASKLSPGTHAVLAVHRLTGRSVDSLLGLIDEPAHDPLVEDPGFAAVLASRAELTREDIAYGKQVGARITRETVRHHATGECHHGDDYIGCVNTIRSLVRQSDETRMTWLAEDPSRFDEVNAALDADPHLELRTAIDALMWAEDHGDE